MSGCCECNRIQYNQLSSNQLQSVPITYNHHCSSLESLSITHWSPLQSPVDFLLLLLHLSCHRPGRWHSDHLGPALGSDGSHGWFPGRHGRGAAPCAHGTHGAGTSAGTSACGACARAQWECAARVVPADLVTPGGGSKLTILKLNFKEKKM